MFCRKTIPLLPLLAVFSFTGCVTDFSAVDVTSVALAQSSSTVPKTSSSTAQDDLVPNTLTKTLTASDAMNTFSIAPGVGTVIVNNVEGKEVFLVSQNNTNETIKTARALQVAGIMAAGRAALSASPAVSGESEAQLNSRAGFKGINFDRKKLQKVSPQMSSEARAVAQQNWNPGRAPTVGSQKNLFIDADYNLTYFKAQKGKLEYSGKYCNIWSIVNQDILDAVATRNLAETFDKYYEIERQIFGKESNSLYIYNGSSFVPSDMNLHTNTGTKINIVVYNISDPAVVGYFHPKDYYETAEELFQTKGMSYSATSSAQFSNGGKYFYINYRYASGSDANKKLALSTLIHEFQHMINYSVKDLQGLYAEDWYNEMLSMLAEDLFATSLGTGQKAPAILRMNSFRTNYYKSGLLTFDSTYSYATSYAFGAWLVRNFGGADFIRLVMGNKKVNQASIIDAVNTISPVQYTFETLFNEYVKDCINSKFFNSKVTDEQTGLTFEAITKTPIVSAVMPTVGTDIGPFGFVYRKIDVSDNTLTLHLSERTKRETVYIIAK